MRHLRSDFLSPSCPLWRPEIPPCNSGALWVAARKHHFNPCQAHGGREPVTCGSCRRCLACPTNSLNGGKSVLSWNGFWVEKHRPGRNMGGAVPPRSPSVGSWSDRPRLHWVSPPLRAVRLWALLEEGKVRACGADLCWQLAASPGGTCPCGTGSPPKAPCTLVSEALRGWVETRHHKQKTQSILRWPRDQPVCGYPPGRHLPWPQPMALPMSR